MVFNAWAVLVVLDWAVLVVVVFDGAVSVVVVFDGAVLVVVFDWAVLVVFACETDLEALRALRAFSFALIFFAFAVLRLP